MPENEKAVKKSNHELLKETLFQYNFKGTTEIFLRYNENLTYKIEDTHEKREYLLRIHKHREGFTTGSMYDGLDEKKLRETELQFLTYLYTQGLHVQTPVENRYGQKVTELEDGTLATVLNWIPGETVQKPEMTPKFCEKLGQVIYQMTEAAKGWKEENEIQQTALWYDSRLCDKVINKLWCMELHRKLPAEYVDCMTEALSVISKNMKKTRPDFHLTHSDLSPSNLIRTENGIVPIDFSMFGYSHSMTDLGGILTHINDKECKSALLHGFSGKIDKRSMDCSYALNVLLGIYLHSESWIKEAWFKERLPIWCKEIFQPLCETYGESF